MARFVLKFNKGESVRWLGHLDLLRAFERVIRRAEVPIAYTQGFNPRAKMSFASAIGVGVTGDAEILTLEMSQELEPVELAKSLNAQMPEGLRIIEVQKLEDGSPKSVKVNGSEFLVNVSRESEITAVILENAVKQLMAQEDISIIREKKDGVKPVNLKEGIESIEVIDDTHLMMRLKHGDSFTPKPSEIVDALGSYIPGVKVERVHRVKLY